MPALSLELLPPRMYAERTALGQLLNFDLVFANAGDRAYELTSVALEVFDRDGARVFRRVLDEHGLRPAIHTIPDHPSRGRLPARLQSRPHLPPGRRPRERALCLRAP